MVISKALLGKKLKEMYDNAPHGEQVLMVHLFGIKFADIITQNGYTTKQIVDASGLNSPYQTELNKGIKMAKYVEIKKAMDTFDFN